MVDALSYHGAWSNTTNVGRCQLKLKLCCMIQLNVDSLLPLTFPLFSFTCDRKGFSFHIFFKSYKNCKKW